MATYNFLLAMVLGSLGLAGPPSPNIFTCSMISLARPGNGVEYKGEVRNGDYLFSASVPPGLVGWGAGDNAPFHGFTVFLGDRPESNSCIVFRIGMRVELAGDVVSPAASRNLKMRIGNRMGVRTRSVGLSHGIEFENIDVNLELPRKGYVNDVWITLVTPVHGASKNEVVLGKFLASFKFD